MRQIIEIIENSIQKFNQNWFNQKKKEFESSDLFNFKTNCLLINPKDYDESEMPLDEEYEFTLFDYCTLDQREFSNFTSYLFHSFKLQVKNLPILEEEAFILAEKLFQKIEKFDIKHCNEFLQNILAQIEESCNDLNSQKDNTYSLVLNEFHTFVRLHLNYMLVERLELQNYLRPVNEKLIFNLNSENYSAFMRILLTSKIINVPEEELAEFSEKYFLYKPQTSKQLIFLPKKKFKKEIDRHSNPGHPRNGIENIKEKIAKGITQIEKLKDEAKDTRNISKGKK